VIKLWQSIVQIGIIRLADLYLPCPQDVGRETAVKSPTRCCCVNCMTRSVDRRCEFPVLKFGIIVYISNVFHVQYETTECRLDIFCRCSSRFGGTTTLGANIVPTAQGGRTKMVCIGPSTSLFRLCPPPPGCSPYWIFFNREKGSLPCSTTAKEVERC